MTSLLRGSLLALCLVSTHANAGSRAGVSSGVIDEALAEVTIDRAQAAATLEAAIESGEYPKQDLELKVHAGEQRRLLGETDRAEAWFKAVLTATAAGWEYSAAELGLAVIESDPASLDEAAVQRLLGPPEDQTLATTNADRFLLLAADAIRRDDAAAAKDYTRKALQYGRSDKDVFARVRASLHSVASGGAPVAVETRKAPDTPLQQAEAAYAAGDNAKARSLAQALSGSTGTEGLAARYLIERIDKGTVLDPNAIGVLLPLSGKYAAVGKKMQEAIELGFASAAGERRLLFTDTGESAETAIAALESLALDQGVIAVIGPVRSDIGEPVAEVAEALRVPMVGLSQARGTTDERPWVLQGLATADQLVDGLLDYVMDERGLTRFAVFAPDNTYGRTSAAAFEEAVAAREGAVTVVEYYDPTATDLIPFAQKLGRKDYEARKHELWKRRKEVEEAGGDPTKVVLPPVIDFEGLFLPDNYARVPLACAGLAYEEFPIGEFQTSKDGDTIPLLGLASWNNAKLVTAGGPYVRSSIFVDIFNPSDAEGMAFTAKYRQSTGHDPSTLEASAYDAAQLVASGALADADTRETFRDALLAATAQDTATGATGFEGESRNAKHHVKVLTISEDGIFPVDEVPESGPPQ